MRRHRDTYYWFALCKKKKIHNTYFEQAVSNPPFSHENSTTAHINSSIPRARSPAARTQNRQKDKMTTTLENPPLPYEVGKQHRKTRGLCLHLQVALLSPRHTAPSWNPSPAACLAWQWSLPAPPHWRLPPSPAVDVAGLTSLTIGTRQDPWTRPPVFYVITFPRGGRKAAGVERWNSDHDIYVDWQEARTGVREYNHVVHARGMSDWFVDWFAVGHWTDL